MAKAVMEKENAKQKTLNKKSMKVEKTPKKGKMKNALAKTPEAIVKKGTPKATMISGKESKKVIEISPKKKQGGKNAVSPTNGANKTPNKGTPDNEFSSGGKLSKSAKRRLRRERKSAEGPQCKKALGFSNVNENLGKLSRSQRKRLRRKKKRELMRQQEKTNPKTDENYPPMQLDNTNNPNTVKLSKSERKKLKRAKMEKAGMEVNKNGNGDLTPAKKLLKQVNTKTLVKAKGACANSKDEEESEDDDDDDDEEDDVEDDDDEDKDECKLRKAECEEVDLDDDDDDDGDDDEDDVEDDDDEDKDECKLRKFECEEVDLDDDDDDDGDDDEDDVEDDDDEDPDECKLRKVECEEVDLDDDDDDDGDDDEDDVEDDDDDDDKDECCPKVKGCPNDAEEGAGDDDDEECPKDMEGPEEVQTKIKKKGEKKQEKGKKRPFAEEGESKKNQSKSGQELTVFMGNLDFKASEEDVRNFVESVLAPEEIEDIELGKNPQGKPRGFGFLKVTTEAAFQKALKLNGSKLNNREVRMLKSEKRSDNRRDSGDFRGNNRGGFRGGFGGRGGGGGRGGFRGNSRGRGGGGRGSFHGKNSSQERNFNKRPWTNDSNRSFDKPKKLKWSEE